ncbi:MAG: SpoIIIAH-like family protein [Clostridia bacterium]|nr:SpoIIIAH-like family protein [Clostridia bacterium]
MKLKETILAKIKNISKKETPKKRRMVVLHRRQITAVALLMLVAVAGYLNWNFKQDTVDPEVAAVYSEVSKKLGEAKMVSGTAVEEPTEQTDDYFSRAKLERDIKRSESMDMLTQIISSQTADKDAKNRAEDEVHLLADFTEKEVMIENLIKAKGYSETVVFMGENLISIAVKSSGLNEVDAAILQDIAISATAYPAEKIKIVEIQ